MGLFDSTKSYERFEDTFPLGSKFKMTDLRVGPTLNTDYGEQVTFIVAVNGKEYRGFGMGIVGQARDASPEDFPADVVLVSRELSRNRTMKLLVPVGSEAAREAQTNGGVVSEDIPF